MATSFDKNDKLPGQSGRRGGKASGAKPVKPSRSAQAPGTSGSDLPGFSKSGSTRPTGKDAERSRRAIADDVRRRQSRAEKRKSFTIIGVCIAVALIIVGAAAFNPVRSWWQQRQFAGETVSEIGSPASVCGKVTTKKATQAQQHVAEGTAIDYDTAPPAFGQHYPTPTAMDRKLYTPTDRPALGSLVHNLEHGYTILWYDSTVADDSKQMDELRALASKMDSTTDLRQKFKIAPWLSSDENGKKFPDDQHVALTHWAAHGVGDDVKDTTAMGVWQYCSSVSGAALRTFMDTYDYTNSPEPTGA